MIDVPIPANSYLINALRQWLTDCGHRAYIIVDYTEAGLPFLSEFTDDPQVIVLNVSPTAVRSFECDVDGLSVSCRFGGKPYDLLIPLHAVKVVFSGDAPNDPRLFCPLPTLKPAETPKEAPSNDAVKEEQAKPTGTAKVVSLTEWKKQN